MDVRFGVHTGLQHTNTAELRELWSRIETLGFDWISIWDHFYAADASGDPHCLEAITAHTALAATTERVTCGSLVYSAGYRHPAVLANAMATLDQVARGRTVLGLGGGWLQGEYDAYGLHYGPAGERLRMLEEYVQCVRGLLTQERTTFDGEFFHLHEAQCEPKPVQARLPIWIGGGGEKVTLKIAAQYADGWNVPFIGPDTFAHKRSVLHGFCDSVGRDPSQIRCAINVGIASDDANLRHQFGAISDLVRPGVLIGSDDEILDRIGQYVDAGADQLNISLRAPFDMGLLERVSAALHLA
jgi:F420-dependent oxidoreductase-like protein